MSRPLLGGETLGLASRDEKVEAEKQAMGAKRGT
jgi:hypothetical protein